MSNESFTPPKSIDEAEDLRRQLTIDIQGIQEQLGDKQRTDASGRRLDPKEYWAWKKRAQHSLNQRLADLQAVKKWIQDHRKPRPFFAAIRHLRAMHEIAAEAEPLDPTEEQAVRDAERFLAELD